MNFQMKKLGLCVMLAGFASFVLPAEAATKLENVKINNSLSSQTRIELQFDGPLSSYQDRLQYQPEQLVLNLSDAESALVKNSMEFKSNGVKAVDVKSNGTDLDVVVGLDSLVPYEVSQQGNSLYVTLGQDPRLAASKNGYKAPTIVSTNKADAVASINRVNGINFKRGSHNEGLLVLTLDNKNAAVELTPKGSHLIAKVHGAAVNNDLLAVMNVSDYATPISTVDVSETAEGAVLDFQINSAEYDSSFDQNGNTVVIQVAKKKPTIKVKDDQKYSGKLLSLSFQDIPVRNALKILAEEVKFNLVMNDSVQGNITVNFDSVPWDQALDTILRVKGLDKRIDGSILLIGSQDELAGYEQKQLEEIEKRTAKEPLITEYIQVNYAKAVDFVKLLSTKDSENSIAANNSNYGTNGSNGADSTDSLLTARGTVTVDERTNTIIIKDTEASIANVKRLIQTLDTPVQQVVIEARLVSVDETVAEDLGVNWSVSHNKSGFDYGWGSVASGGSIGSNTGDSSSSSSSSTTVPVGKWYESGRTNFGMPTTGALLNLGKVFNNYTLDLALSALESENRTEVIASPRVTTTNQKEAVIEQGFEIPSVTAASSGATTVEWKKAVLSLSVTPQITPDDSIFLDLEITQDSLGETVATTTGQAVSIQTRKINTSVLVGNGETLVLGGIFLQTITRDTQKVPLLGDIPVVGWLFKRVQNKNQKREVLIFITPHIVEQDKK